MIQISFADKIRTPMWTTPACKCSDCILHPESSHGIHFIGAYQPPSMLSRRGNRLTDQSVDYRWTFHGSTAQGGKSGLPFASARSNDDRAWCI